MLPAAASAELKAGVGDVDASWHVGAASGQYASDGARANDKEFDPHGHTTRRAPSYGLQSRLRARALVVEGPDGKRIAIVKQDLYLPQDLLWRRAAQLIEAKDIGITRETFSMVATHNHSSPYYSSPSWGVWTFQDAFDLRAYEYYAQRLAAAVEEAANNLRPVRVGGAVRRLADVHRSVPGPETADDGTPAGFPQGYGDHDLIVVRFDDISDPANPKPLANLVNYAVHPESLDGPRPDLRRLPRAARADARPRDRRDDDLQPGRRRRARARAQPVARAERAPPVLPRPVRPGGADGA